MRRAGAVQRREAPIPTATLAQGRRRIAIVGGGTAGHVYPALAVAAAYRVVRPDVEVTFFGTPLGFEGKLVPAAGFPLQIIPGWPFFRSGVSGKLRAAINTVAGMRAARRAFAETGTQMLLSFGGYVSAGPVLAARRLGLPVAMCEANVCPGLANRMLARFADSIFLGWPEATAAFRRQRVTVTGIPLRAVFSTARPARPMRSSPCRILVCGGSLGSAFLNRRVPEVISELARRGYAVEVHHQTGGAGVDDVRAAYGAGGVEARVADFVADVVEVYDWADLAITSAGAITLAELAAAALPALVVPLAAASEDHQTANARAFAAATGCQWISETQWGVTSVSDVLAGLVSDPQRRRVLGERMGHTATRDAAVAIVRGCEDLLR